MIKTLGCLGNCLWFLCGGFVMALAWYLIGLCCFLSVLGIPWGRACFVMGNFTLSPFGTLAVDREQVTGKADIGTGILGSLGNIIWFFVAGLWLALGHVASALACALTIYGLPFAWQHLKLASFALCPIGKTLIDA